MRQCQWDIHHRQNPIVLQLHGIQTDGRRQLPEQTVIKLCSAYITAIECIAVEFSDLPD